MRIFLATATFAIITATASFADEWHKTWPVTGPTDLHVDVDDGRIMAIASDRTDVQASIHTTGWKIAPQEVRIEEHQTGNHVELFVKVPRSQFWVGQRSIEVELRVPKDLKAYLRTRDGRINAESLSGDIKLDSGDGRIEAISCAGNLDAHTGDGSMRISGRFDLLRLRTGDGSIEADIRTGSKIVDNWSVTSGDGHITVRVPGDFAAALEAHTGDGKVTSDLPITIKGSASSGSTGDSHDIRGALNGGGKVLKIETGDGSIRIGKS